MEILSCKTFNNREELGISELKATLLMLKLSNVLSEEECFVPTEDFSESLDDSNVSDDGKIAYILKTKGMLIPQPMKGIDMNAPKGHVFSDAGGLVRLDPDFLGNLPKRGAALPIKREGPSVLAPIEKVPNQLTYYSTRNQTWVKFSAVPLIGDTKDAQIYHALEMLSLRPSKNLEGIKKQIELLGGSVHFYRIVDNRTHEIKKSDSWNFGDQFALYLLTYGDRLYLIQKK